jgi:polyhydroxybutyrate depolymerase
MRYRLRLVLGMISFLGLVGSLPAIAAEQAKPAAEVAKIGPLTPGNHVRRLQVDGKDRSYIVHVPPGYDATKPTPVVLIFHGAYTNGAIMIGFCGMNPKSDAAGFIAVYPNGLGLGEGILFFNAFLPPKPEGPADDVKFTASLLDDLATVANVDPKRVFATGMSNGGMMCHRLAAELSDRIAAIAPVAGTVACPLAQPRRAVPVISFHGTADRIVPFNGTPGRAAGWLKFKSVEDSIRLWLGFDGCPAEPKVIDLPETAHDGTTVKEKTYGPGTDGAEVVSVEISGAGHTWPGKPSPLRNLGKSTLNISANDMIWDFFLKHPMK